MRLVMYPVLLVRFWRVLEGYPWWDRGLVVLCQAMLCMFNYGALRLHLPYDLSVGHQTPLQLSSLRHCPCYVAEAAVY